MCRSWLLLTNRLWKSVSTHLRSGAVTQTQVCESFEVESTTNNKHDIQSRYVANTMAYTGELFLMSFTYLLQDVHPRGDISLSEMLSHWCVWLANTLFLSCFSFSNSQAVYSAVSPQMNDVVSDCVLFILFALILMSDVENETFGGSCTSRASAIEIGNANR